MSIMKIIIRRENIYTALEFRIFLVSWNLFWKKHNALVLKIFPGSSR